MTSSASSSSRAHSPPPRGPLDGVRVLDMSRLLPGPFASLVLADMGAAVDKLEEPGGGDPLRAMPPFAKPVDDDAGPAQSSLFLFLNRNKRSVALDLKTERGRDAFKKLVRRYDVLLEQFRPGVLSRLGLGVDVLREANPALVVCSLTGYGQTGPLASRAGHDLDYLARAGALYGQGAPNGAPPLPAVQIADIGGALWSVIGILGALAARAKTGLGAHVDVSMLEASLGFAAIPYALTAGGASITPGGEALTGGLAGYATYVTKDGRAMALGALEPKFLAAFLAAIGVSFEPSMLVPGAHQDALRARLATIFLERTQAEWIAFAARGDFCLEPVLTPSEAMSDPHLRARGAFFRLPSPWGELVQMRVPTTTDGAVHRAPPRCGEHTREVLAEAGFGEDEIEALAPR